VFPKEIIRECIADQGVAAVTTVTVIWTLLTSRAKVRQLGRESGAILNLI
jgi:hypothetical protein